MVASSKVQDFLAEKRGAIMVVSVFVCFFLIGILWYLLGIGQAMIFRDHMQDAADATTFSAAVVHARCMNMIAAINLIMMALVAVHLILAVANAVLTVVQMAMCALACFLNPVCDGDAVLVETAHSIMDIYDDALEIALPVLSATQHYVLGDGAIVMGTGASVYAASLYKNPDGSTVNGAALSLSIPELFGKDGLPVQDQSPDILCTYLTDKVLSLPGFSTIADIVSGTVTYLFCGNNLVSKYFPAVPSPACIIPNELGLGGHSWWDDKKYGPKEMWNKPGDDTADGKNGSDWNITFGGVLPNYAEQSQSKIGVAGRSWNSPNDSPNTGYFAMAEFYFDCNDKWSTDQCDGAQDHAIYAIGWKARLIRAHIPSVGPFSKLGPLAPLLNFANHH